MPHSRYAYFPFGAGPRICLGSQLGMTQLVLATAWSAARFDVEVSNLDSAVPGAPRLPRPARGLPPSRVNLAAVTRTRPEAGARRVRRHSEVPVPCPIRDSHHRRDGHRRRRDPRGHEKAWRARPRPRRKRRDAARIRSSTSSRATTTTRVP
ncbi:cytochrome P450 [Nonomuraea fuscirosea]|uniref:cytochrome P450 n=1 Tax=Nonomuraea fuscirosea TaxID=1291556 RepID=UPI003F4D9411